MRRTFRVVASGITVCLVVGACNPFSELTGSRGNRTELFVYSRALALVAGDTVSVGATRRNSNGEIVGTRAAGFEGTQQLADAALQWRVSDSSVAGVTANGLLRAKREGFTHLIVSDGERTDSTTVTVAGPDVFRAFTAIKLGIGHACAIDTDRALWCWGGSWSGELGTGERLRIAHYLTPQRITLPEPIVDVAVGSVHTCALGASGAVYCSGDNLEGQIPGTSEDKVLRFRSLNLTDRLTSIDSKGGETCGLTTAGEVYCWGGSEFRRGTKFAPPIGTRFATLSVAGQHRCALTNQSQLYCWGSLSGSNGGMSRLPALITTPAAIKTVNASASDVCVVDVAGAVYCWQPGARRDVTAEQRVGGLPIATTVAGQLQTRCVLAADGRAWCQGFDLFGALGRGGEYNANQSSEQLTFPVPQPVSTTQRFVTLVGTGETFCGLTAAGRAYCWGNNRNGLVADGMRRRLLSSITTPFAPLPVPVR
jgi:alpha-tubulin suppressor-like RCC1 family protein